MIFDISVDARGALDKNVSDNMAGFWALLLDGACVRDISRRRIHDRGFRAILEISSLENTRMEAMG